MFYQGFFNLPQIRLIFKALVALDALAFRYADFEPA